jgi:hypothetical protein
MIHHWYRALMMAVQNIAYWIAALGSELHPTRPKFQTHTQPHFETLCQVELVSWAHRYSLAANQALKSLGAIHISCVLIPIAFI